MSKHFVKPAIATVIGLGLGFAAMYAEAKPLDLQHEAMCYGFAAQAGYVAQAKNHRINLRQYDGADAEISYFIGFANGVVITKAQNMVVNPKHVAGAMYKDICQVEI